MVVFVFSFVCFVVVFYNTYIYIASLYDPGYSLIFTVRGQTPSCSPKSPYHATQNSTQTGLHEQLYNEITACCSPAKKRPHLSICAAKMPHAVSTTVVSTSNNPRLE